MIKFKTLSVTLTMVLVSAVICLGDVVITLDGDEIEGKVISVGNNFVSIKSKHSEEQGVQSIPLSTIFMIKYDDGRKKVFGREGKSTSSPPLSPSNPTDTYSFRAGVNLETGLFGLVNIDEKTFDPGVFSLGVTPVFEWQYNSLFSFGGEYMILWAKPKKADDSRFIMNINGFSRLTFPLGDKINFQGMAGAGFSIWPGSDATYEGDTAFFKDRAGWDIHAGLGVEYLACSRGSFIFTVAYNANFSTLDDVPVTLDMLLVSIGPRLRF